MKNSSHLNEWVKIYSFISDPFFIAFPAPFTLVSRHALMADFYMMAFSSYEIWSAFVAFIAFSRRKR